MTAKRRAIRWSFSAAGMVVAVTIVGMGDPAPAQMRRFGDEGYVGPAYLQIPGVKGDAKDPAHKRWIRIAAHYWEPNARARRRGEQTAQVGQPNIATAPAAGQRVQVGQPAQGQGQGGGGFSRRRTLLTLPAAPRQGPGTLAFAVDKKNPALFSLMERCNDKTTTPEANFSTTPDLGRPDSEVGERPAGVPSWLTFKLKDVQFVDCPVVDKAPEQAIVVKFGDIEWVNWQEPASTVPLELQPAVLKPLPQLSGATKSWVVTWIAMAHDVSEDQCPQMAEKPTEADYYSLMSNEEAERERVALAGQGGPNYQSGQMGRRGPSRLDVTMLPGVVPDPGMPEPQTRVARGLNLDGDEGTKRKHRNYVSADGKVTGIDNQLFTTKGCIAGLLGHKGFITQFANNQMRDGQYSLLVEVSGIDSEQNDNEVYVTISYSEEDMAKSGSGAHILADYSFPLSSNPEFTHYFSRLRGQIVDGVVVTEQVQSLRLNLGVYGRPPELKLADARMRIELKPDGTIKGVLGGYRDWRVIASAYSTSGVEFYFGFHQPALYNALKRNADGMKDPVTGEYNGISTAYDIEGVPAFVVTTPERIASADGGQ